MSNDCLGISRNNKHRPKMWKWMCDHLIFIFYSSLTTSIYSDCQAMIHLLIVLPLPPFIVHVVVARCLLIIASTLPNTHYSFLHLRTMGKWFSWRNFSFSLLLSSCLTWLAQISTIAKIAEFNEFLVSAQCTRFLRFSLHHKNWILHIRFLQSARNTSTKCMSRQAGEMLCTRDFSLTQYNWKLTHFTTMTRWKSDLIRQSSAGSMAINPPHKFNLKHWKIRVG